MYVVIPLKKDGTFIIKQKCLETLNLEFWEMFI